MRINRSCIINLFYQIVWHGTSPQERSGYAGSDGSEAIRVPANVNTGLHSLPCVGPGHSEHTDSFRDDFIGVAMGVRNTCTAVEGIEFSSHIAKVAKVAAVSRKFQCPLDFPANPSLLCEALIDLVTVVEDSPENTIDGSIGLCGSGNGNDSNFRPEYPPAVGCVIKLTNLSNIINSPLDVTCIYQADGWQERERETRPK